MSTRQKRGFALFTPEKQHETSSLGGKAAHESGAAHKFTKEQARKAGKKGGLVTAARRQGKTVEQYLQERASRS
jgi:hypothetical protein